MKKNFAPSIYRDSSIYRFSIYYGLVAKIKQSFPFLFSGFIGSVTRPCQLTNRSISHTLPVRTGQIPKRGFSRHDRLRIWTAFSFDCCRVEGRSLTHDSSACLRHVTGPFPVSPIPTLAGEVAHR